MLSNRFAQTENVYYAIRPFYYLSKIWGFSTYTIGNRTPSKSHLNWWQRLPVNGMAVAVNLTVICAIIYAIDEDVDNIPPSDHVTVNVGSQYVLNYSMGSIVCTLAYWIWKRDNVNGIVNGIYLIDKMVSTIKATTCALLAFEVSESLTIRISKGWYQYCQAQRDLIKAVTKAPGICKSL